MPVLRWRVLVVLLVWPWPAWSATPPPPAAAIASAHPLATEAGLEILAQGGNAFDAAVAVAAALAVVEPTGSGLGGGGFWLLHRARDGFETMVDARERAPRAATPDMYLDAEGRVDSARSLDGPLAAGIPGVPAALVHVARRYGRLSLAASLAPAMRLAGDGFAVSAHYQRMARWRQAVLAASPAAAAVFLDAGQAPEPGWVLRQPDLALTLRQLAEHGHAGFYAGPVAQALVRGVTAAGGIWSLGDLADYQVVERAPIMGRFGDLRIISASLPSSGGVVLVEALNILAAAGYDRMPASARAVAVVETMRLAYRDRARYLGDPDQVRVDVAHLLSADYARELAVEAGARLPPSAAEARPEAVDTTHFSIIDRDGNRAAVTLSINGPFGSGLVPPGTGVLLNNEMDDFAAQPGVPNLYGLVGGVANAVAPGKRPLSSMTPTFLETPDQVVVLGTPGGSRIISMVLLATLDVAGRHGTAQDWVSRPRYHQQYQPEDVQYEAGALDTATLAALAARGYRLKLIEGGYGNMQAVVWDRRQRRMQAASDPRGEGKGEVR